MNGATVYINRSYFRRANDCLTAWPLDANYCRVRVTVKTHRNKLSATLSIVAELTSTSETIFDRRPVLRRSIPLGSVRETALVSRRRGENNSVLVHCLTLRRQNNPLLGGSVVNLYQESRLEIDKIYSCLTALRQPLCTFLDLQSQDGKNSSDNDNSNNNSWIVRLLNNLTVQSLGLCSDYLYILRVTQDAFELQDVNQASILTCRMCRTASCASLNGWFFVQYVGNLDQDCYDVEGGYLAMQCARSSQLLQLFQRFVGLSFGHRRWPSEPCLEKTAAAMTETFGSGRSPKREASFNVHRPRSSTNRPLFASPSSTPSSIASPRRLVSRFSFFRRQQQQQQQQPVTQQPLTSPARSPTSIAGFGRHQQQQLRVPQDRATNSPLCRNQSSSSVLSNIGVGCSGVGEELGGNLTSSSAETSSSSSSDASSYRSAASVASLSALEDGQGGKKVLRRHRRRQFLELFGGAGGGKRSFRLRREQKHEKGLLDKDT